MIELYSEKRRNVFNRAVETGLLFVIGIYILIIDISKTTLKLGINTRDAERFIIIALVALTLARLVALLTGYEEERKVLFRYLACALAIGIVYLGVWRENPSNTLLILSLLTISTIKMDHRKILKVYIGTASAVIFTAIAMAWIGAIDNYVYIRDMTIRSSWGIKYPTDMMSLLFFLLIAVWVIYGEKGRMWYLLPGGILMVMSYFVADSRTGVMCGALFIITVLAWYILSRKESNKTIRIAETCCCLAFPFFTILTNGLMLAYRHGFPWASKANEILSGRLYYSVQALNEYGPSLWGKPLEQVGWGGSVFARPDYNFVDISYVLLLLRFGVVALIVINILWVMMTRHAFKVGDKRLALALTLIAVNCVIEHHILQLNYDVFVAMPFAILASKGVEETANNATEEVVKFNSIKAYAAKLAVVVALIMAVIGGALALLPKARTLITMINFDDSERGRAVLAVVVAAGLFFIAKAVGCAYSLLIGLINKDNRGRKRSATMVAALVVVVCLVVIGSNYVIDKGAEKRDSVLESERGVIELVQAKKSGKLYVKGMPELYQKKFGGISSSLFNGEELGRYRNTSVVMDLITDSPCFFNTGFLYLPISDNHALLTNDEPVIRALQKDGYHLTGYFPLERTVDLTALAKKNNLHNDSDGAISLHGEKEAIEKGPRKDLRAGRYTVTYDLSIDPTEATNMDDEICELVTTFYKGEYELSDVTIGRDKFDNNGECLAEVVIEMPDAQDTDFCVYPIGQNTITINGISYQKTPKRDIHSIYDKDRVKIREEYYTLDGEPYEAADGYFARDLGYDKSGNINHEIYYDRNNNKVLNLNGNCEVYREFDGLHHVLREEYYGIDGKRCSIYMGQSAVEMKYDNRGNQTDVSYYDVNNAPTLVGGEGWGGYHRLTKVFDETGRIEQETFLGIEGEPTTLVEGYASRRYKYDEAGNRIEESYYDIDDKPVNCTAGYSAKKRFFDEFNRLIREEYYDVKGRRITLDSGQSAVEYIYDEEGHQSEMRYFDINDRPVAISDNGRNGYQRIVRKFDELGRVVYESYFDESGKPVVVCEGYASIGYDYDEKGSRIKEIHFDLNGNELK